MNAAPGAPGLPDGGGSGGQSAGNIVIVSGVLMEIGLLVAGMGFWGLELWYGKEVFWMGEIISCVAFEAKY
jgi:hypothetical protein